MKIEALGRGLLDFFLPVACVGCASRLPLDRPDALVCINCTGRLRAIPSPRCPRCDLPFGTGRTVGRVCEECAEWPPVLKAARSAVVMEAPASSLVHAFKYEGWRELAPLMGGRIAALVDSASAGAHAPGAVVVVPMPTTPKRERHRGYNQAFLLAEVVAERSGLPLVHALLRAGGSRTQVALHRNERAANVSNAFSVRPDASSRLRGASVILVDDVLTTGATALAAARALRSGGVDAVTVLTFGRALSRRDPRKRPQG